jgi:predicted DNA-binding protein
MKEREKLSRPMGVRLGPSVSRRLAEEASKRGVEESEVARAAIERELRASEDAEALRQVGRLREAGIDLEKLVDLALAKKALDDAQEKLPGFFPTKGGGR